MLTKRQWIILQQALHAYDGEISKGRGEFVWDPDDGEDPTNAEIAELAVVVGQMPHGG